MQIAETHAKAKRRADASKYKDGYLRDWKSKLAAQAKNQSGGNSGQQFGGKPWEVVVNNIGKTVGDFKGQKDLTRMRESILHKAQDK